MLTMRGGERGRSDELNIRLPIAATIPQASHYSIPLPAWTATVSLFGFASLTVACYAPINSTMLARQVEKLSCGKLELVEPTLKSIRAALSCFVLFSFFLRYPFIFPLYVLSTYESMATFRQRFVVRRCFDLSVNMTFHGLRSPTSYIQMRCTKYDTHAISSG